MVSCTDLDLTGTYNPTNGIYSGTAAYGQFRGRLLQFADNCINNVINQTYSDAVDTTGSTATTGTTTGIERSGTGTMNSQGVIVWDIEGDENKQPTGQIWESGTMKEPAHPEYATFVGDPRLTGSDGIAPEMAYVDTSGTSTADEFFKKFRNAGLSLGVTIRPQRFIKTGTLNSGTSGTQQYLPVSQVETDMIDKISYAIQHFGASIFTSTRLPSMMSQSLVWMRLNILRRFCTAFRGMCSAKW
jgi:hypothetical protein